MLLLCAQAVAQTPPSDVSISTFGLQSYTASALAVTDVDALLGERLRWTLTDRAAEGTAALALLDARFTVDPTGGDPAFEWSQVRQAEVQVAGARLTLDLGRSPVLRGGPRLVDGVQATIRATDTLDVGGWAGLQPDLFTTLPRLRPGLGPIVAYGTPNLQASLVGDATLYDGEVDRVGALSMFRYAAERAAEASARVDLELVGDEGPRLVDGLVRGSVAPVEAFRVDAMLDAFSSYLYQSSTTLDPDRQRFDDRLGAISQADDLTQDTLDPRLNLLVGLGARFAPRQPGAAPLALVEVRDRFHPDPANRYLRLHGQGGVIGLAESVDVLLDGNWIAVDDGSQVDAGLMAVVAPGEGPWSVDGSFRVLQVTSDDGDDLPPTGWYSDLYVDVVSDALDLLGSAGVSVANEPDVDTQDRSYGAFLTMTKYLRPPR